MSLIIIPLTDVCWHCPHTLWCGSSLALCHYKPEREIVAVFSRGGALSPGGESPPRGGIRDRSGVGEHLCRLEPYLVYRELCPSPGHSLFCRDQSLRPVPIEVCFSLVWTEGQQSLCSSCSLSPPWLSQTNTASPVAVGGGESVVGVALAFDAPTSTSLPLKLTAEASHKAAPHSKGDRAGQICHMPS